MSHFTLHMLRSASGCTGPATLPSCVMSTKTACATHKFRFHIIHENTFSTASGKSTTPQQRRAAPCASPSVASHSTLQTMIHSFHDSQSQPCTPKGTKRKNTRLVSAGSCPFRRNSLTSSGFLGERHSCPLPSSLHNITCTARTYCSPLTSYGGNGLSRSQHDRTASGSPPELGVILFTAEAWPTHVVHPHMTSTALMIPVHSSLRHVRISPLQAISPTHPSPNTLPSHKAVSRAYGSLHFSAACKYPKHFSKPSW